MPNYSDYITGRELDPGEPSWLDALDDEPEPVAPVVTDLAVEVMR
jgi:hypothetical protein